MKEMCMCLCAYKGLYQPMQSHPLLHSFKVCLSLTHTLTLYLHLCPSPIPSLFSFPLSLSLTSTLLISYTTIIGLVGVVSSREEVCLVETWIIILIIKNFNRCSMITMAQSAVNWCNMHTHVDRTHSLTHLDQYSYNHIVRSTSSAITAFGEKKLRYLNEDNDWACQTEKARLF